MFPFPGLGDDSSVSLPRRHSRDGPVQTVAQHFPKRSRPHHIDGAYYTIRGTWAWLRPIHTLDGLRRLDLDFDVNAGRKVEALQRINRLGRRLQDVDEALVNLHLKVFAAVLVLVRPADHGIDVALRGERHRSTNLRLRANHRFNDLLR